MKDKYLMLSKVLVSVMFYLGIPTTIAVPFVLKWYGENMNPYYSNGYYIPQTAIFIVSGIFACLIVYELKNMLKTVEEENCFVKSNVISLDRMGWYSFIIAVVTFIRMSIYFTPGCFAINYFRFAISCVPRHFFYAITRRAPHAMARGIYKEEMPLGISICHCRAGTSRQGTRYIIKRLCPMTKPQTVDK